MLILRRVFFQIVFLALGNAVFGQNTQLYLGGEGGLNMGSIWINSENQKFKLGGGLGLYTRIPLKKTISIKTGLYLEQKGTLFNQQLTDNIGNTISESKVKLALSYLTIPIMLRAAFGQKLRFFLNGGPYLGVLFKAHQLDDESGASITNTDLYKKTELALAGGIGITYPLEPDFELSFEVKDCLGISNIYKNTNGGGATMRTNTIQVLIGICYTIREWNQHITRL